MDESFNSSDVEVDDPAPSRFAAAGGRSLKKIVSGAPDDRLASKKAVKELQLQHRTPGSEYQTVLWSTRFQTFRQVTLNKDPKSIPTAEDLERFIHSVPSKINGQSEDGKVSHGYIMNGVKWILKWMNFHWREGKLDSHDRARIDSTLLTLQNKGTLTKKPSRGDRLWITNDVVRRMISTMLSDAIVNGTMSWDATILRILSILVPASLGARSGDVSRSHLYRGDEYLKWEDVYIRLNDEGLMFGSIILNYTKGTKSDPTKSHGMEYLEVTDQCYGSVCVLNMLLAHALRHSMVKGAQTWDMMIETMKRDKKITWAHPKRPLLCGFSLGNHTSVNVDQPSSPILLLNCLKAGAKAIGLKRRVVTHDLRRGAAFEQSVLGSSMRSQEVEGVRDHLNHTSNSAMSGTTRRYIGHSAEPTWNMRLAQPVQQRAAYVLDFADPRDRQNTARASKMEIDQACADYDLDPTDSLARNEAARLLRKAKHEDWIASASAPAADVDADAPIQTVPDPTAPAQSGPTSTLRKKRRAPARAEEVDQYCIDHDMDPDIQSNRVHAANSIHTAKKMRLETSEHGQPKSNAMQTPASKKTRDPPRKSRIAQSPSDGDRVAAPPNATRKLPSPPKPADATPTELVTRRYPARASRTKVTSYSILPPEAEEASEKNSRVRSPASNERQRLGQFHVPGPDDDYAWNSEAEESDSENSSADECESSDSSAEEVDAESIDSDDNSDASDPDSEMEGLLDQENPSMQSSEELDTRTLHLRDDLAGNESQLEQAVQSVFGTEGAIEGMEPDLSAAAIIYKGGRELAKFLSEVNEVKWEVSTPGLPSFAASGGSRNEPTRLIFYCPKKGCTAKYFVHEDWEKHAKSCKVEEQANLPFGCDKCGKRFPSKSKRNVHLKKTCDFQPQRCAREGCTDQTLFEDRKGLEQHQLHSHGGFDNPYCPVADCERSTSQPFTTPYGLKDHFRRVHKGLDPSMLNDRLPPKHDPKRWVPIQCPWRHECDKGGAIFDKFIQLATHAQHKHGLGRLEVERKVIEIQDSRN